MATPPNTTHYRQLHGCGTCMGHHQGQQVPSQGHAPPLDTRLGPTMSVLSHLGPRQTQQSGLLYKTVCPHSPLSHAFCISPSTIPANQPSSPVSCQPELQGCIESRFPSPGRSSRCNQNSTGKLQHKSVTAA